jgi:hypothetical protein
MPVTSVITLSTLLQACQKLERELRHRGEVVGSLSLRLPEGLNSDVDLHDPALAGIIRQIAHGLPDPCDTPPWCTDMYWHTAAEMGAQGERFAALIQALGLFYDQLPQGIRPHQPPHP